MLQKKEEERSEQKPVQCKQYRVLAQCRAGSLRSFPKVTNASLKKDGDTAPIPGTKDKDILINVANPKDTLK